jgi:ribosome-associated toxin RatA of RatAB toxin-antitoxin module
MRGQHSKRAEHAVAVLAVIAATSFGAQSDAIARCEHVRTRSVADADGYRYAASDVVTVPVPIEGSGYVRGRSTVVVKAPIDKVRETVLAFSHYPEFMPHHRACRVLGRTPQGGRDVYAEISVLHGALKLWARFEMQKARMVDGVELHAARFIEGNVHEFTASWRLKKIDDKSTELTLDVFLNPKLPLPKSVINQENLTGSAGGVDAMRTRIEAIMNADH